MKLFVALCIAVAILAVNVAEARIGIELEGGFQIGLKKEYYKDVKFFGWTLGQKRERKEWVWPGENSEMLAEFQGGADATEWKLSADMDIAMAVGKESSAYPHFELVSSPIRTKAALVGVARFATLFHDTGVSQLGGAAALVEWCGKNKGAVKADAVVKFVSDGTKKVSGYPALIDALDKRIVKSCDLDDTGFKVTRPIDIDQGKFGITPPMCLIDYQNADELYTVEPQATAAIKFASVPELFAVFAKEDTMFCTYGGKEIFNDAVAAADKVLAKLDDTCKNPTTKGVVSVFTYYLHAAIKGGEAKSMIGAYLVRSKFTHQFDAIPNDCKVWIRAHMDAWVKALVEEGAPDKAIDGPFFKKGVTVQVPEDDTKHIPYHDQVIPADSDQLFTRKQWIEAFSRADDAKCLLSTHKITIANSQWKEKLPNGTVVDKTAVDGREVGIHPSLTAMFTPDAELDKIGDDKALVAEIRKMKHIPPKYFKLWAGKVWDFVKDINDGVKVSTNDNKMKAIKQVKTDTDNVDLLEEQEETPKRKHHLQQMLSAKDV